MNKKLLFLLPVLMAFSGLAQKVIISINQVGFNTGSSKVALVSFDRPLSKPLRFSIVEAASGKVAFSDYLGAAQKVNDWTNMPAYHQANFSGLNRTGKFKLRVTSGGRDFYSSVFQIKPNALAELTVPSILHYYRRQRANTPSEMAVDSRMKLYGSEQEVDMRGGWCDASGDVSKYFSHLAYANFMSPQQIPLVTWSLINTRERIPGMLKRLSVMDSVEQEALWGADYLMRALSKEGYFYMIVFSYFNKDPQARRVVGLLADSKTTNDYQCAFREGGGMAIAALARIARWGKHGAYTPTQYLDAAKRAFAHLQVNNLKYTDDGKENIIDDYCALMAATELWITTADESYKVEARKRAFRLNRRLSKRGYFIADDGSRPFWHASDAGLPVISLARYLDKENDAAYRKPVIAAIRRYLTYQLQVTGSVSNPFGYARQTFLLKGNIRDGFFIPHENETGWWWQGENARLGSLAAAAIIGGRLAYPGKKEASVKNQLAAFATRQLNWILGANPYQMCFMYKLGYRNVPYMHSQFGHGSEQGGISNGITGKEGQADGSGIDFKTEAQGNEWRWTEQWIPHAAWFLQAVTAMAQEK